MVSGVGRAVYVSRVLALCPLLKNMSLVPLCFVHDHSDGIMYSSFVQLRQMKHLGNNHFGPHLRFLGVM